MTFQDQYKHPKWQKKRLKIMERDKFQCKLCNETDLQLHVHHKRYGKGRIWEVDNDDLITVCIWCHDFIKEVDQKDLSGVSVINLSAGEEYNSRIFFGFHNGEIYTRTIGSGFGLMGDYSNGFMKLLIKKYKESGGRLD